MPECETECYCHFRKKPLLILFSCKFSPFNHFYKYIRHLTMKVLVLGATGNVGSRIVPALLAHKHNVVIYVRSEGKVKKMFPPSILSQITIVKGNATEAASIEKALVDQTCDALVNSAGLASVFPWQAPHMQEIINAVARAGVEASCKLKKPIRAWFLGGMTALDVPGMKGTMLMK